MRYTLSQIRSLISIDCFPAGASTTLQNILINKVRERFYVSGKWKGLITPIQINVFQNTDGTQIVTLPRWFETILGVTDNTGPLTVRSQWFSYLKGRPQDTTGYNALSDLGDGFLTFLDLPASGGANLIVKTHGTETASITFFGTDANGLPILNGSNSGEVLAISNNATSVNTFFSLSQILIGVTNYQVDLYSVDGSGNQTLIAMFEAGETNPDYRRYLILGETDTSIAVICKRRYLPLIADNSPMDINNIGALENGLRALHYEQNVDFDHSEKAWGKAMSLLNGELDEYEGDNSLGSITLDPVGMMGKVDNMPGGCGWQGW